MAVQILNDLPDAAVNRGDPIRSPSLPVMSDWSPRVERAAHGTRRLPFILVTVAVHVAAAIGFLSYRHERGTAVPAAPITVQLIDEIERSEPAAPVSVSLEDPSYTLPAPEMLSIDVETPVAAAEPLSTPISTVTASGSTPPMIESVEYVRAPTPVYPRESSRRREFGTVVLRVVVDPTGHAAHVQVERSSGYVRLDVAAREAVERALFRPYEVNGIRQAAQVLVPVEFARRAS